MKHTLAALVATMILTSGEAGAFEKFDPAAKRLMPRDQLALVERLEALAELHATQLFRIKDAKQRAAENERLGTEARQLHEGLVTKLRTEGVKNWVGVCGVLMPKNVVILDSWQPLHLDLQLRSNGPPLGKLEAALSAIKIDDIVRFSTKPDPTIAAPRVVGKTFYGLGQLIKRQSITAVEKVGTGTTVPSVRGTASARKRP